MAALTGAVRARFGSELGAQLGHGGEATVFALGDDRVLRLYHEKREDLAPLAAFYEELAAARPGYVVPRVLEHGEVDGLTYTIDARIDGISMTDALPGVSGEDRTRLLDSYLRAAETIGEMGIAHHSGHLYHPGHLWRRPYYGEVLRPDAIRADTWPATLLERMERSLALGRADLETDVPGLARVVETAWRRVSALPPRPEPRLVHGDYFPGNVMVSDGGDVTAIIDFGPLTAMGDVMQDICSAVFFLEVTGAAYQPGDVDYLTRQVVARYGDAVHEALAAYRAFYAVRFCDTKSWDPHLYAWCMRSLLAVASG